MLTNINKEKNHEQINILPEQGGGDGKQDLQLVSSSQS